MVDTTPSRRYRGGAMPPRSSPPRIPDETIDHAIALLHPEDA
jgi:hypothetical protein